MSDDKKAMSVCELKSVKGQKILFLNTRSLFNHLSELQTEFNRTNFVALGFCETWLNLNVPTGLIGIEGYRLARLDRALNKHGGGVAIYIRDDLNWDPIPDQYSVSNTDIELLTVKISRPFQSTLFVSTVYLPPKSNLAKAIDALDRLANYLPRNNCTWVMGGDFNINLCATGTPARNRKLMENFSKRNILYQLIQHPTRKIKKSSSLLDHIYVNRDDYVHKAGNIVYGLSDHDIVFVILKKNLPKKELVTFVCRNMRNYSLDNLSTYFDQLNWDLYFTLADPEFIWYELYTTYINGLDLLAPNVDMKCREKDSWVSSVLLDLIRARDAYKEKADSSPTNEDYEKFKELRIKCKHTILKDKRDFIRSKLVDSKANPTKYWANVSELFPSKKAPVKGTKETISLTDDNGADIDMSKKQPTSLTNFIPASAQTYQLKSIKTILRTFILAKTSRELTSSSNGTLSERMKHLI